MIRRSIGVGLSAVVLAGALVACAPTTPDPTTDAPGATASRAPAAEVVELTVYGAASLREVLEQATVAYEAAHPGTTITLATDSSAALAAQIEQGAPADVFLSADTATPRRLVDAGLAAGDPVVFAANTLVVIVPVDNPGGVRTPADLARAGLDIIAAGDEAPISTYAQRLVANLARVPGYPADFEAAYQANVVSREDNVKAIVAKLGLGEGEAGIVYASDAGASSAVRAVEVPDDANVAATYAGVVVGASPRAEAAARFLEWLTGPEGQAILAGAGFLPPSR